MDRRSFLLSAASAALAGCDGIRLLEVTPRVVYPGMREGHLLRDNASLPPATTEISTDVVILGSGAAGLAAAWKLSKEGFRNFMMIHGPEIGGNASGGQFGDLRYPRGAHYLPLPSMESTHIREMLFDFGIILDKPMAEKPYFDEACIVHAPDERLYFNGEWQDGLVPVQGISADDAAEHKRFFNYIDTLKKMRGKDGKKVFCIPVALSSMDIEWRQLDGIPLSAWMAQQGYASKTLHWYLNYVCRDEYGAQYDKVSAWSGLHYFASRAGQADNAADGAVLTWPEGLNALSLRLFGAISRRLGHSASWQRPGFAVQLSDAANGVRVLCAEQSQAGLKTYTVHAKRAICAMPMMMASRVVSGIRQYGFDPAIHMPSYAPWMVSNFLMDGFPSENSGVPLAWDNVVYQGRGLGYVVSTHQDIRVAAPPKTVFSAYHALSAQSPAEIRKWLAGASPQALYEEAASDLKEVYGLRLRQHAEALEITVRGHAMASPLCGFLSNSGLQALRNHRGKVLFAHSDLSGFSVFEEAAWWGYQAALQILA